MKEEAEEEEDLESLFYTRDSEDEVFFFNSIDIQVNESATTIVLHYSYCDDIFFQSRVIIDEVVNIENYPSIFAIGMFVAVIIFILLKDKTTKLP